MTATRASRPGGGAIRAWRQAPRTAKALIIGTFVNRMAGLLQIFIVLYLTAKGFPAAAAAGALSAYGVGVCVGLLAGGSLADRIGVKQTIIMSMAGSAVLLIAIAYLNFYPAIVGAVGLVGAVSQAYRAAAASQAAFQVGCAIGPAAGVLVWRHAGTAVRWLCGLVSTVASAAAVRGMRAASQQSADTVPAG